MTHALRSHKLRGVRQVTIIRRVHEVPKVQRVKRHAGAGKVLPWEKHQKALAAKSKPLAWEKRIKAM